MARLLTLPGQTAQQPQYPAPIDRGNALGARVLSAHFQGRNAVTGQGTAFNGTIATGEDVAGRMTSFDGSSYVDLAGSGLFNDETKPVTICYFSKPMAAPTYAGLLRVSPAGATAQEFIILRGANGTGYEFAVGTAVGSVPSFPSVPASTDGVAERVVVVASQGMVSSTAAHYAVWINRVKYTSSSTVAFTAQPTNGTSYFGWDGADSKYAGLLDELVIFDGVLSDSEIASYYDNPWQIFSTPTHRIWLPSATVQILRPASDISEGAWTPSTGVSLFATINETPFNDATYNTTPSASTFEVKLGAGSAPGVTTGHIARYRAQGTGTLTVRLVQGTTVIATNTPSITAAYQTFTFTLSGAEAAAITDYTDLRLRFTST